MTITAQLTALRHMTPSQLREKYQQVFGEPTRTGNKEFLLKRIAWRIQSIAEGGLSERARKRAEELARDADLWTTIPKQTQVASGAVARSDSASVPLPGTVLTPL